jgi:3',5'-cyclic AMP phosphodiesterase CpdA
VIIAQITDLHARPNGHLCNHVVDSNAMLARAVDALRDLRPAPDVVLATGDLTDTGRSSPIFRTYRKASASPTPSKIMKSASSRSTR